MSWPVSTFEAQLADALGANRHRRLIALLEEMRTIVGELEPARQRTR